MARASSAGNSTVGVDGSGGDGSGGVGGGVALDDHQRAVDNVQKAADVKVKSTACGFCSQSRLALVRPRHFVCTPGFKFFFFFVFLFRNSRALDGSSQG